jgi:hypothetical protein
MWRKRGSSVNLFDRHPGTVRERMKRGGGEKKIEEEENIKKWSGGEWRRGLRGMRKCVGRKVRIIQ